MNKETEGIPTEYPKLDNFRLNRELTTSAQHTNATLREFPGFQQESCSIPALITKYINQASPHPKPSQNRFSLTLSVEREGKDN